MGCYGSLSPVSDNESLSNWNESLCVEMSRYEITRVVGHPPETFARTRLPCVCWIPLTSCEAREVGVVSLNTFIVDFGRG